jgi:hypothetical protein
MPRKEDLTINKIEQNLFKSKENFVVKMTEAEHRIMLRYQACFIYWNDHPDFTDTQVAKYLMDNFDISHSQAFRDIPIIERLLGSVKKSSKEWTRYRVTQLAFQDHQLAIVDKQFTSAAILLDKLIKANKLDQPDTDDINWDEIKNPELEPSNDIRVLDPKLYSAEVDRKRELLRAKYKGGNAEETTFEMVNEDGN